MKIIQGQKIVDLNPTWLILLGRSQLSNPSDWPCFFKLGPNSSMNGSVHPSVCPSQIFRCLCHRIIMKFSEVIIIDKSDVHAKSQGQRSKGKVKELKRNFNQIWAFLDQNSSSDFTDGYEIMHKAWSVIEHVPCSRSSLKFQGHTGHKHRQFLPELSVSGL